MPDLASHGAPSFWAASLRVHLRSYRYYLPFMRATFDVFRELPHVPGLIGARALVDRDKTFWVVSLWESEQAIGEFYGKGAHARATPNVPNWCDEAAAVTWKTQTRLLPSFEECHRRMRQEGRLTSLEHPSPPHLARDIRAPGGQWGFNTRSLLRPRTPAVAASVKGTLESVEVEDQPNDEVLMTMRVLFSGCTGETVRRAFFAFGFYDEPPILSEMMCATEERSSEAAPGSRFDITGFRPARFWLWPMLGTRFELQWEGDAIVGAMHGALWSVRWKSTFEDLPGPATRMTERFLIHGCPPYAADLPASSRALGAVARAIAAVPVLGRRVRRLAGRTCARFHEIASPYHQTIPLRVERLLAARTP